MTLQGNNTAGVLYHTIFMYLCYVTGPGTLKDVVRGQKIKWDPDTQSIIFTTNSTAGSSDIAYVSFYDNSGNSTGDVYFFFSEPSMTLILEDCSFNSLPATVVPTETDKTWTIGYNAVEQRVALRCNGVQVANVLMSDSVCYRSDWRKKWERKPTQIEFSPDFDNASDSYGFSGNAGKYNVGL